MAAETRYSFRMIWPALALIGTLVFASGFDSGGADKDQIPHFDKVAHFFVFGLMGTLWFRWLKGDLKSSFRFGTAFALTLAYGVADEWIQAHNPHRVTDFYDWLADGFGGLTGICVYRTWTLYRRVLETPIGLLLRGRVGGEN